MLQAKLTGTLTNATPNGAPNPAPTPSDPVLAAHELETLRKHAGDPARPPTPEEARKAIEEDAQRRIALVQAAMKAACEEHRCNLEVVARPVFTDDGRIACDARLRIVPL